MKAFSYACTQLSIVLLTTGTFCLPASAQTEAQGIMPDAIKVGQTIPYSGNLSSYANIAKAEQAYFNVVNNKGGVNGRKIVFLSKDDAYSPPKTVEQTRSLVENDEVALMFSSLGTPTNLAVRKYLNSKSIPQLFIASGNSGWNSPAEFPWTMGFQPSYYSEAIAMGRYIRANLPNAKVGVLHQADDFGRDYLRGIKDGLGDKASQIVVTASYSATDPTIDSQIVTLKTAGVDAFVDATSPKFTAQAIRRAGEISWKPTHFIPSSSNSVGAVMTPAGLENGIGVLAPVFLKDPTDSQWRDNSGMKAWSTFMDENLPGADRNDINFLYGYTMARALVEVLRSSGATPTRASIMKAASNLDLELDTLLPGIKLHTSPTEYMPIGEMYLSKFDGTSFRPFGGVISAR